MPNDNNESHSADEAHVTPGQAHGIDDTQHEVEIQTSTHKKRANDETSDDEVHETHNPNETPNLHGDDEMQAADEINANSENHDTDDDDDSLENDEVEDTHGSQESDEDVHSEGSQETDGAHDTDEVHESDSSHINEEVSHSDRHVESYPAYSRRYDYSDDDSSEYEEDPYERERYGYERFRRTFNNIYRCYSMVMLPGEEREHVNQGGKIILPLSALDQL